MAKIEMGILGGISGRVGTVVGYYRRGAWFVRAYQPHINDRKSDAQLQQRSRFKAMIQFASPATPVLRVGLKRAAAVRQITEGNAFLRLNHRSFRNIRNNQNIQNIQIDYSVLKFSQGALPGIANPQYTVDEGGVLRVRWRSEGGVRGDKVHLYAYSPALSTGLVAEGRRGDGILQLLLPEGFVSEGMHLWAFTSNSSGNVSNTQYINSLETEDEENAIHPGGSPVRGAGGAGRGGAGSADDPVPAAGLVAVRAQLAAPPGVAVAVVDG